MLAVEVSDEALDRSRHVSLAGERLEPKEAGRRINSRHPLKARSSAADDSSLDRASSAERTWTLAPAGTAGPLTEIIPETY